MRYLEVSVHQPPDRRNPMHQFVVDRDGYTVSRLLYRSLYATAENALLFHVEGPRDPYVGVLAEQPFVDEYAVSPRPDGTFYVYVRGEVRPSGREFADAFAQPGVLIIPPVEFRADGTVRVTAVGPATAVQAAVESVPEAMDVDVRAVGEYFAGRVDPSLELTQRQFEAVTTAVECGYYGTPRDATLAEVADRLGCASGTAGELLRRAERTVMANLVEGGPF